MLNAEPLHDGSAGPIEAATLDADFAVYRFGLRRERAFEIAG